jgi:hypothetical protein
MTALASAAVRLTLRSLAVFPLRPGTKIPLAGSHGHHDGSADPDVARARWKRYPDANIGIATGPASKLWVLDIDAGHGGTEALRLIEAEHGRLPVTVEVATAHGGRHFYWKWTGAAIRNSTSRVGPGIDVRGENGSVVAPPSVLADGGRYTWVANGARGFAEPPKWLIALAVPPPPAPRPEPKPLNGDLSKYVAAAVAAELRDLAEALPGRRNAQLNVAAFALGRFIAAGMLPEDWTTETLEARGLALGLSAPEVRATVQSGLRAGMANPRGLS